MASIRESYTKEFKQKTVEHMEDTGKSLGDMSRELGISKSTLSPWVKQYGSGAVKEQTQIFLDYDRLKKLEQQYKELQEENEILKKAMHFFTKDRD